MNRSRICELNLRRSPILVAFLLALSLLAPNQTEAQDFPAESRFGFKLQNSPDVQSATLISRDGSDHIDMSIDSNTSVLSAVVQLGSPIPWYSMFDARIVWRSGKLTTMPLRIRADRNPTIEVLLSYSVLTPERDSLSTLDSLGNDVPSLLTKYLGARDVYNGIQIAGHPIKIRALKMWFDAAYQLHTRTRYFDVDNKVLELALELENVARSDASIRRIMVNTVGIRQGYFLKMREEFLAAAWAGVDDVRRYRESGNIKLARQINEYYLGLFAGMSEEEQDMIARVQNVTKDLLERNSQHLSQLASTH